MKEDNFLCDTCKYQKYPKGESLLFGKCFHPDFKGLLCVITIKQCNGEFYSKNEDSKQE